MPKLRLLFLFFLGGFYHKIQALRHAGTILEFCIYYSIFDNRKIPLKRGQMGKTFYKLTAKY